MVIMMDGWMARERARDWGAGPRNKDPQRVEWREIKSAVIYRLEQRVENASGRGLLLEKYVVAARSNPLASNSSGDCAGADNFGPGRD